MLGRCGTRASSPDAARSLARAPSSGVSYEGALDAA
jgi:hypothetical protein